MGRLQTDRPRAENHRRFGKSAEVQCIVTVEEADLFQAWDRNLGDVRAGGYEERTALPAQRLAP